MVRLSEFVVRCLKEKGELSAKEIAKFLGIHQKAVNVTLGHLRRQGVVERGSTLTPIIETPYGPYQSSYLATHKWKLVNK